MTVDKFMASNGQRRQGYNVEYQGMVIAGPFMTKAHASEWHRNAADWHGFKLEYVPVFIDLN